MSGPVLRGRGRPQESKTSSDDAKVAEGEDSGARGMSKENNTDNETDTQTDNFGQALPKGGKRNDDWWSLVKRNSPALIIMSLIAGGTAGAAGGILATAFTLGVVQWMSPLSDVTQPGPDTQPQTDYVSMLEAKIAEVKAQTREEYEAEIQRIDNKTDNLNRTLQNKTSELLELSNVTQHLNQTLQAKTDQFNGLANLTSCLNETLRNKTLELDKLANATAQLDQTWQNRTAELNASFVKSTEDLKQEHEAQIDAINQKYSDLLEERIRKVKEETERNFTASLNKTATELNQTCEAKIQATKDKITIEMGEMQTETVSKISNVDSRQDFMFTLIHQLGFMRLDTWGPALAVIALLEFVLFVIVLKQGARAGAAVFARGREGDNGNVQQPPKPSNRAIRLRNSGDRGRNTLCAICFRTSDLQKIRSLSEKLVQATHNAQRMRVEPFVVDTRNDIQDIPACRAALVFVDPDERLMILEDRRHHMGGDRRDTVQELLNTGSEVLLIIYDDPTEGDFGQDELYSRRLSQVRDHDLLKQLDRKGRVLSIKRGGQFKDHQKEHIVRELNRVFQ